MRVCFERRRFLQLQLDGVFRQSVARVPSLPMRILNKLQQQSECVIYAPRLQVLKDNSFAAISVTAEKWLPMLEVREAALLAWLEKKQSEGYSLIGLEQTAESRCLPEYDFPPKCVLVLGREKEGLPPEVIQLLDASVEIPQLGLIRSLNVHVSGAIAVYEYSRQQRAKRLAAEASSS